MVIRQSKALRMTLTLALAGTAASGLAVASTAQAATTPTLTFKVTNDWGTGYCQDAKVTTTSTKPVTWNVAFTIPGTLKSSWSAVLTPTGSGSYTASGVSWNKTVTASTPATFGMCVNRATTPTPTPTTSSPAPTTSSPAPTTSAPAPTTSSPAPTTSSPAPTSSSLAATFSIASSWDTGFTGNVHITNPGPAVTGWRLVLEMPAGTGISSLWNGTMASAGQTYTVTPASWNAKLATGASVDVGFTATSPSAFPGLAGCTIDGATCTNAQSATPTPTTSGSPSASPTSSQPTTEPPTTEPPTTSASPTATQPTQTATPTATPSTTPSTTPPPSINGGVRVGYYTAWGVYGRNYVVKDLVSSGSASRLTHINYAFGNISPNGTCFEVNQSGVGDAYADYSMSYSAARSVSGVADTWNQPLRGNFNQLKQLKAAYPNLKVLISLGGWTWSNRFSDVALTQASREKFVSSCIDLYLKGNLPAFDNAGGPGAGAGVFDGIDIDWEYPGTQGEGDNVVRAADTQNYTLLLQEFRRQLDAYGQTTGKRYQLTAAVSAGPSKIAKYEIAKVAEVLDLINVMTYDFRGGWDATGPTNFQSNLYPDPNSPGGTEFRNFSVSNAVSTWRAGGAPANKIVVGVPFYGRGWTGVTGGGNGLYAPAARPAPATYETGMEDYKVLANLPGYTTYRDPVTKQSWIFNGTTFWSFDDPTVIATKMAYIRTEGLAGAMVWSMDGDTPTGTLIKAIDDGLK